MSRAIKKIIGSGISQQKRYIGQQTFDLKGRAVIITTSARTRAAAETQAQRMKNILIRYYK